MALAIALAGALGALSRWGLTALVGRWTAQGFPWGTLVVNVLGSFLVGWFATWMVERTVPIALPLRVAILTGFLGAITTFSALSFDTVLLWTEGAMLRAALNLTASVGLGVLAAAAGVALGLKSNVG